MLELSAGPTPTSNGVAVGMDIDAPSQADGIHENGIMAGLSCFAASHACPEGAACLPILIAGMKDDFQLTRHQLTWYVKACLHSLACNPSGTYICIQRMHSLTPYAMWIGRCHPASILVAFQGWLTFLQARAKQGRL